MHKGPFLWRNYTEVWSATWPAQTVCAYRNATVQIKKGTTILSGNNEIPQKVLTNSISNMWAAKKTDISKIRIDMEHNTSGTVW